VKGPRNVLNIYNKGSLGGVNFGCKHIERNKKAVNSIIMAPREDKICGGIYVGRILSFISHMPPGCKPTDHPTCILDVEWFEVPSGSKPHFNASINCPVVSRTTKSDPGGNFWPFLSISPTKLMLLPYIPKDESLWQVCHTDSDFIERFKAEG